MAPLQRPQRKRSVNDDVVGHRNEMGGREAAQLITPRGRNEDGGGWWGRRPTGFATKTFPLMRLMWLIRQPYLDASGSGDRGQESGNLLIRLLTPNP